MKQFINEIDTFIEAMIRHWENYFGTRLPKSRKAKKDFRELKRTHYDNVAIAMTHINGDENTPDFLIGKYEITQEQWNTVMATTQGYAAELEDKYGVGDEFPMYYVSWYDAVVFCNMLSIRNDLEPCYSLNGETDPSNWGVLNIQNDLDSEWEKIEVIKTANGYRLPTSSEWTLAANDGHQFSGDGELDKVAWHSGNSNGTTHPVGRLLPNDNGVYDMTGNIFEWCADTEENSNRRLARGGNFVDGKENSVIDNIGYILPGFRGWSVGFRVVRNK